MKNGAKNSKARKMSTPNSDVSYKMTCLERLIRTHPIWFLPKVNRDEVTELLTGTETGVSIRLGHKMYICWFDIELASYWSRLTQEWHFPGCLSNLCTVLSVVPNHNGAFCSLGAHFLASLYKIPRIDLTFEILFFCQIE